MSKRNKIIKNFVILCFQHKKMHRDNKKKFNGDKTIEGAEKKSKKSPKNEDKVKKTSQKIKKDLLPYENFNVDHPS